MLTQLLLQYFYDSLSSFVLGFLVAKHTAVTENGSDACIVTAIKRRPRLRVSPSFARLVRAPLPHACCSNDILLRRTPFGDNGSK